MKITKCTGNGQGSCKRCSDKGKLSTVCDGIGYVAEDEITVSLDIFEEGL